LGETASRQFIGFDMAKSYRKNSKASIANGSLSEFPLICPLAALF
jgi:hypothetical protein